MYALATLELVDSCSLCLVKLTLCVHYTDQYPTVLPELSLRAVEGEVDDEELDALLEELRGVVRSDLTNLARKFLDLLSNREKRTLEWQ